jgi:hypothetical protein
VQPTISMQLQFWSQSPGSSAVPNDEAEDAKSLWVSSTKIGRGEAESIWANSLENGDDNIAPI